MKKLFDKIKTFIDAWKIWLFFLALFGTNGIQAGLHAYHDEPKELEIIPISEAKPATKTIIKEIIREADNEFCEKLIKQKLNEHEKGRWH